MDGYGCAGLTAVRMELAATELVAKMLADVTTMYLLCIQLGPLADAGQTTDVAASLAKMDNARKARKICLDAREIMGGNGVLHEYHVARH